MNALKAIFYLLGILIMVIVLWPVWQIIYAGFMMGWNGNQNVSPTPTPTPVVHHVRRR